MTAGCAIWTAKTLYEPTYNQFSTAKTSLYCLYIAVDNMKTFQMLKIGFRNIENQNSIRRIVSSRFSEKKFIL